MNATLKIHHLTMGFQGFYFNILKISKFNPKISWIPKGLPD